MNIPIYCLNLIRASDRKENITRLWKDQLGLDIIFWSAIDKNNIQNSLVPNGLKLGEYAILLSYIKLFEHILSLNINEVIIMEDDIYPCPIFNFLEQKTNIGNLLENYIRSCIEEFYDLQLLMMIRPTMHSKRIKIYEELNYCYKIKEAPWGAFFNYYTIDGIKNIYSSIINMQYPVDHYHRIKNIQNKIALTKMPFGFHHEYSDFNNQLKTYK